MPCTGKHAISISLNETLRLTCGALVVGGLPKDSTDDRYWDSREGDELPREPVSGSPGNPWNISPAEPKEAATPTVPGENGMSPVTQHMLNWSAFMVGR